MLPWRESSKAHRMHIGRRKGGKGRHYTLQKKKLNEKGAHQWKRRHLMEWNGMKERLFPALPLDEKKVRMREERDRGRNEE